MVDAGELLPEIIIQSYEEQKLEATSVHLKISGRGVAFVEDFGDLGMLIEGNSSDAFFDVEADLFAFKLMQGVRIG